MKSWIPAFLMSVLVLTGRAHAAPEKVTVVYKQAGGVDIKADVYADASDTPRPAVVWIHGGGLINGNRSSVFSPVRDFAFAHGYVLVSLDYRLAPETKLPEILCDIEDAFRWMRSEGAKRFAIDPDRIAVTGGSAGGFLTLASGFRVQPAPSVLLAFWGYGELLGDWAAAPSPLKRHHPREITAEEAAKQASGPPIADSSNRKGNGTTIYMYGRQSGEWAKQVSGFDPHREPEKFTPLLPLKNVTAKYPPTVLVHGTADTDVPFEQSQLMARELEKHGVAFELHAIEGGEHGLPGGNPEVIAEAYRKAFEFVNRDLTRAKPTAVPAPAAPSQARVLQRTAKGTITPVELDWGDELDFKLRNGEVRKLRLVKTEAYIAEGGPQKVKKYAFSASFELDGRELKIERVVPAQESFYEPVLLRGMRLWLDAVSDIFQPDGGFMKEKDAAIGIVCQPRHKARLAVNDVQDRICPEKLALWYPETTGRLDVRHCYRGEDVWMGPYDGKLAHGGLDLNMKSGTQLFAPINFDDQYYFNSLAAGDNNNRWRGIRRWPDGSVWWLQSHHLNKLLVPEHTPLKRGQLYAETAGVHIGVVEHTHFAWHITEEGEDYWLDPWILFWQSFQDNKKP